VGLKSLKSLNLTNVYPNNNNNNKVKSKPLELRSRVKILAQLLSNKKHEATSPKMSRHHILNQKTDVIDVRTEFFTMKIYGVLCTFCIGP
jgi:hypothetical protein